MYAIVPGFINTATTKHSTQVVFVTIVSTPLKNITPVYKLTLSRLAGYSLAGESVATCHEYIDNCINTLTNRYGVTIKRGYHITIKT